MNAKDKILNFLMKNKGSTPTQRELQKEVLPELNEDQVKELLYQIIDYKSNLIKVYNEYTSGLLPVQYTGLIDEFLSNGGFAKIRFDLREQSKITEEKETLEIQNLELQNENLEYQKTIRNKEEQIRSLTRDNLRLGNWDIRFRWYFTAISFLIGIIVKHFISK